MGTGVASPIMSASSLASTSSSVIPSKYADLYFSDQHFDPDVEIDPMFKSRGGFACVHQGMWMNMPVAVKVVGEFDRVDESLIRVRTWTLLGSLY